MGDRWMAQALMIGFAVLGVATSGCVEASERSGAGATAPHRDFSEIFTEVRTIILEERDTAMISRMPHRGIDIASDGRIVMGDPAQMKIRIYSPEGALLQTAGRLGEAPGEYSNMITGLLFLPDGSLLATDSGNRRITRLRPDLSVDTTFTHPEVLVAGGLRRLPGGNLLFHALPAYPREFFDILTPDGKRVLHSFHEHSDHWEIPYWGSAGGQQYAVGGGGIFVANALSFPLYFYSPEGELLKTFGSPPPSWRPPSRPQPGDFGGIGGGNIEDWYRTFTRISEMHVVADSVLLVSVTSLDPDEMRYRVTSYRADLYDLDGRKRYEDVALPGRPIFAADHLYIILTEPPDGPWTLAVFRPVG